MHYLITSKTNPVIRILSNNQGRIGRLLVEHLLSGLHHNRLSDKATHLIEHLLIGLNCDS